MAGTAVATTERQSSPAIAAIEAKADHLAQLTKGIIPTDRFMATFKMAVMKNPDLQNCSASSLLEAVSRAAADGLMIDGREAALQVRNAKTGMNGNKAVYGKVAVYVPMFQGLMKRARNSGEISAFLGAHIVYANEVARNPAGDLIDPSPSTGGPRFTFTKGDDERIFHDPIIFGDTGAPVAVYSIVRLKDGTLSRELMTWAQVMAVKNRNVKKGKNRDGEEYTTGLNPVWETDEDEMAKKTCIRRHCKKLPLSSELSQIFANMDAAHGPQDDEGFDPDDGAQIEVEVQSKATKQRGGAAAKLASAKAEREAEKARAAAAVEAGADPETGEFDEDPAEDEDGNEREFAPTQDDF